MEEKKQVRTRHDAFTDEAFFPNDETRFISGEGCRVLIMPKTGDIINENNIQNTSQTKYFLTSEADKIGYFMHHSKVWQSCEWQETGKESPVRYRLIITLKCADTETENNALALMTTRFRFSLITATKSGLVFRSCKYSKLQAFNLYDIAKRFEIADFAVTCHNLNDGYIEDVTEDFINDDIKKIQKHRAKYMVLSPLYSKVKDRIIKKTGLANVAKRGKGFKDIGKKYAK
jgi:hypothetical protein